GPRRPLHGDAPGRTRPAVGVDPEPAVKVRLLLVAALAGWGCAHGGEPDIATLASNSDQVIWEAGQKALEKHQYESARQHFKRIIDGFPQSEYGPAARLALADSHFQEAGTDRKSTRLNSSHQIISYAV